MSNCLDTDTLVGVGAAIGWETEDTLRHIATCQECHEELRRLTRLHGVLLGVRCWGRETLQLDR